MAVVRLLSMEELETGLRLLVQGDFDHNAFWDEYIASFRQTVLFAIRETSDGLLSPQISSRWRMLLQRQLEELVHYLELADLYSERRSLGREAVQVTRRPASSTLH